MKNSPIQQIIEAQNQPFKCATFSGGGAKGAIYSGAIEALSSGGVLKKLEAVAGTSAGSITAAMIATGISSEKYQKITQDTNLKNLLGEGFIINKDGKPLLKLLRNTIRSNIYEFLKGENVLSICSQRLDQLDKQKLAIQSLAPNEQEGVLREIKQQEDTILKIISSDACEIKEIEKKAQDPEGKILFQDIALLRVLAPDKFKELVIVATIKDTGDLEVFDSRNTPDIEVALACRASSSIPMVLKPVKINGKEYVDGACRDNIPLDHFNKQSNVQDVSDKPKEAKKSGRTLALAFGSGMKSSANIAIYSAAEKIITPSKVMEFLTEVILKVIGKVGGKFKYSEESEKTHQRLRKNSLNTVVLDTGKVGTLSFGLAQEKSEYLHIKGFMQTSRYLDNHDIVPIKDPNFEMKDFFLTLYENSQAKTVTQDWKNKVVGGKTKKLKILLEFCKDSTWQNTTKEQLLANAITISATERKSGKVTGNTNSIKAFTGALNNAFTKESVRLDFIKTLEIDTKTDKRFNATKTLSENITNFKFEDKDFQKFLQKKKPKSMKEKINKEQEQKIIPAKRNLH